MPETIFQTMDNIPAILAPTIWVTLSCPRYLGYIPTNTRAITDKNGRNWKHIGLISTHAGNVRNAITTIQVVKIFPLLNK